MAAEDVGDAEREVGGLAAVETRVAHGFVGLIESILVEAIATTDTFGDGVSGEFDMDAARPRAFLTMSGEEAADLLEHLVEVTGLATTFGRVGVAVHWIAGPDDGVSGIADCGEERRQAGLHLFGAHAGDEGEAAGHAFRD